MSLICFFAYCSKCDKNIATTRTLKTYNVFTLRLCPRSKINYMYIVYELQSIVKLPTHAKPKF